MFPFRRIFSIRFSIKWFLLLLTLNNLPIAITFLHHPSTSNNPNDIKFLLFPSNSDINHPDEIKYEDEDSLLKSRFIPNVLTVIIVHGLDYFTNPIGTYPLITAYAQSGIRGNIIGVNWEDLSYWKLQQSGQFRTGLSRLSNTATTLLPESLAGGHRNAHLVSDRVAQFILWLCERGMVRLEHVHLIGMSLGGSMVAGIGRRVANVSMGTRVWRITGLDPVQAEPGLNLEQPPKSGDADFVDVFHTNLGQLGDSGREADLDIYEYVVPSTFGLVLSSDPIGPLPQGLVEQINPLLKSV